MSAQKQSPKLHLAPEHISHDRSLKAPESIQYDGTTNTLQRDHDVDAPEIDQTASTLQASADLQIRQGLEIAYSSVLPEAVLNGAEKEVVVGDTIVASRSMICGLPQRVFWIVLSSGLFVAIAVAVGVGVKLGLHAVDANGRISPTASPTTSPTFSTNHAILNASALAAVNSTNGDHRLFFQDNARDIIESIYNFALRQWAAGVNNVIATDARA
ncbi:hypothetical protein MMC20_007255, partial [Loxospora ochrophaea]|nr:hypothetical protein [Loxospora ochrophaea]